MGQKIKISIILIFQNAEKHLANCLDHLINQTLEEIEIIVINNGSTDQSRAITQYYANKDSRINVFNQDYSSEGLTRNFCIKIASGEYIHFLNVENYLCNNTLEHFYFEAKNNNLDIVDIHIFNTKGEKVKKIANQALMTGKEFLCKNEKNPIDLDNKLYKKSFLNKSDIKYSNKRYWNVFHFNLQAYKYALRVKSISIDYCNKKGEKKQTKSKINADYWQSFNELMTYFKQEINPISFDKEWSHFIRLQKIIFILYFNQLLIKMNVPLKIRYHKCLHFLLKDFYLLALYVFNCKFVTKKIKQFKFA